MNFTFGIVTDGKNDSMIIKLINSIEKERINNYEIIIIGNSNINNSKANVVPFDESLKKGWITKKKNLITKHSNFDNIVYMHDYYILNEGWYEGFLKYGDDWDICMNVIFNNDGSRFRDWCVWDDPNLNYNQGRHRVCLPKYDYNKKEYMYISGGYWVAKKQVMDNYPLNENLLWGQGEDLEWSKRVLNNVKYSMNQHSSVSTLKYKNLSAYYG